MSKNLDASIEKTVLEFIRKRVAYIRDGDQKKIDSTYCPCCLNRRNEYNCHDYDFYRSLIESGFAAVQQISIIPRDGDFTLPFRDICHYGHHIDYVVRLSTVSDRQTLWALHFRDDEPYVALPVFEGKCFDSIATGTDLKIKKEMPARPLLVQFDEDQFASELSERIYLELNQVKRQLRLDRLRALVVDCAPWHSTMSLSILTDRECFEEDDEFGKWSIEEWRYLDFTDTPDANWPYAKDLIQHVAAFYGTDCGDNEDILEDRKETIYRACAKALLSKKVAEALRKYRFNLAEDFEFGVFDPDDFEKGNYCETVDRT